MPDRLRILLNGLSARRGGVRTYLVNLLNALPEDAPVEIFVLSLDSLPLPVHRENIRRLPVKWPVGNPIVRVAWERIYIPKLLKEIRADILFCPGGIVVAKPPVGCKTVAMFRNMLPFDLVQRRGYPLGYMRLRHWILEKVLLKSFARSDAVIFISEFGRKVIEDRANGQIRNAVVIPHGINPAFRTERGTESSRPTWLPFSNYLLYASDIDFYKSQVEVVQAYALLKQRRLTTEKLVLVGSEARDYGRRVRSEIHRLGLARDVVLMGKLPYERMPDVYRHAALTIFASQCENCPNILLEALAAGQPIVASDRPPIPEFLGDAGVYFDPTSPLELAEQLSKMLENPGNMRELSAKAKNRSLRYDWTQTAVATWSTIQQLCNPVPQ